MSDTTLQNCKCCQTEDDCIEGLCQLCSEYNFKLQKQLDLLTLALLQEKNKYNKLANVIKAGLRNYKHGAITLSWLIHQLQQAL